ncbi:MAG: hypothetical protein K5648_03575 [Erysipelotrichaceae bacterium]|nr:hypothetical protein [Erysipelotrichaceae bacterium]
MFIKIIVLLIVLYLIAIYPDTSRKSMSSAYEKKFIAHRGLFNNKDVPENSLVAFRKAVENDFGIELDVQLTTDDRLVVFHDASLKRMTGVDKDLTACSYEELQTYPLLDTKERIPLFEDVLKVLRPDTPLVIEIKAEGRYIETTRRTVEMMRGYKGLYNMESFNPKVVRYLRMNEPQIIRGQLSYNYLGDPNATVSKPISFILTYLMLNFLTRPDYIAYDVESSSNLSFQLMSKLFKAECVAWTVKSKEQFQEKKHLYQCFIFDSWLPDNKDLEL